MKILKIRSDHGGEFENEPFEIFCEKHGIVHEFSSPRTPQQNRDVERKNRTLQEMARTMIHENNLAKHFWAEAVNTICYVQNRIYIKLILEKTAYELFKGRRRNISYFHQFGCTLNSETLCVEESMHIKFDDKELGNETLEQDESCADIQVTEDTPEPDQTSDSEVSPEAEPTSEA